MENVKRREFIKLLGAAVVPGALVSSEMTVAKTRARVIVIGGGFGGATCANYLRRYDSGIDITLIEPKTKFITCPFSNTVLAGINSMADITHDYNNLRSKRNITVIHDTVKAVDPISKKVTLKNGKTRPYDRLELL